MEKLMRADVARQLSDQSTALMEQRLQTAIVAAATEGLYETKVTVAKSRAKEHILLLDRLGYNVSYGAGMMGANQNANVDINIFW